MSPFPLWPPHCPLLPQSWVAQVPLAKGASTAPHSSWDTHPNHERGLGDCGLESGSPLWCWGQATDEAGAVASGSLGYACCFSLMKRTPCGGPGHPCLLTQLCPRQHEPACEGGKGRGGARLWTRVLDWRPWEDCSASSLGKSCSEGNSVMGHFLQALSAPSASGAWVMVLRSVP